VYLLCEHDRAIPLPVQELMVQKARSKGADIKTELIKTGHTPYLVVPDEVARFVRKYAGEDI
jgi:predicted aspartyl protease